MPVPVPSQKPKILIPEKVSPDGLALLKGQFEVDEKKGLSPEELREIIGEYEALIVRSETKVTAELLEAAKKLKVVARAGVGVDNVDVASATKHGIIVVNSPSGNINAAAEHTIAREYMIPHIAGYTYDDSDDGCGSKRGRCRRKHQSREVGTKPTCRYRGQG
jgi:D-3-phosphoglycerate dehydrogenase